MWTDKDQLKCVQQLTGSRSVVGTRASYSGSSRLTFACLDDGVPCFHFWSDSKIVYYTLETLAFIQATIFYCLVVYMKTHNLNIENYV